MPFIRLCDSYIDHPKFLALSSSAFRLWHEGMAFCRKHRTDGAMAQTTVEGFRYYQPARLKELTTTILGEGGPLWEEVPGGFKVRNYLKWNLSREEDEKQKSDAKARTKKWRETRFRDAISNAERDASQDAHVPNMDMDKSIKAFKKERSDVPENPDEILANRAATLLETFAALYSKHRNGAKLLRLGSNLDWTQAVELCRTWDDARLEKLIKILLTSDEEWISRTDRGWRVFVAKATWCDERLAAWEAEQRQKARPA